MLTEAPLHLELLANLFQQIGILNWLILIAAISFVIYRKESTSSRIKGLSVVLIALVLPMAIYIGHRFVELRERRIQLDASMTMFEERCKKAGEKIQRTFENVDGIVWMKWRPRSPNQYDQFRLDDPYGWDCGGEACIAQLLRVTAGAELMPELAHSYREGYRYVETTDPSDGVRYKYVQVIKSVRKRTAEQIEQYIRNSNGVDPGPDVYGLTLERQPIEQFTAKFGVTWDDVSTREDREHWIAGGSLKVVDLRTTAAIAERIGFMVDRGLGSKADGRSPWGFATDAACPAFPRAPGGRAYLGNRSQSFVFRVLVPTREE